MVMANEHPTPPQTNHSNPLPLDDNEDNAEEHESQGDASPHNAGWVTFEDNSSEFGDFEYAPLSTDANCEENFDEFEQAEEVPREEEDCTTSGFLRKKFTQEHIDLIKECMKNVKLAYVPEWAKITNEEPRWLSALKRKTNDANPPPEDTPEK